VALALVLFEHHRQPVFPDPEREGDILVRFARQGDRVFDDFLKVFEGFEVETEGGVHVEHHERGRRVP